MNPSSAIHYFDGDTVELVPAVTMARCGGHFPGSSVLYWKDSAQGAGALFTGDTIRICADERWLTFMYSYPNEIPLDELAIRRIVSMVEPFAFDSIYDAFKARPTTGAKAAVVRSAERYIAHLRG
jgi:glyoxylase-like metal-dependent hydrolase (beta-lactamase superfamily II)